MVGEKLEVEEPGGKARFAGDDNWMIRVG